MLPNIDIISDDTSLTPRDAGLADAAFLPDANMLAMANTPPKDQTPPPWLHPLLPHVPSVVSLFMSLKLFFVVAQSYMMSTEDTNLPGSQMLGLCL